MAEIAPLPGLPPGIKKETTRYPPAQKYLPPRVDDEVEVHCVGCLKRSGQQFFSTREGESKPFKYTVGSGEVIEGWDLAVRNMKKGEHATFTIPPQFAYKEDGHGDTDSPTYVPPNSVIELQLELVSAPLREDLFEDEGVLKLEVKDAPNGRPARMGDECQITYKVIVEGEGVAMASQHAMYKLGSQQLGTMGKSIDKALTTMKRGDEVKLACSSSYGFSQGTYAGKAVEVRLGLEEIFEVHDQSLAERDKTVLRKRIKESEGGCRAFDTANVKVRVSSVTANGEKVLKEPKEFSFMLGNGQVCDAIEGSVLEMKATEEAILRCESSEAVVGGLLGLPEGLELPVMIHLVILTVEKVPEKWDLDGEGRLARGRERKEVATELYKRGRIRLACHLYELIAELFAALDFFKADERGTATELRRAAVLNRAMCMLKLGNLPLVKELCSKVLKEDNANPKALFRRAKASVSLREYTEAIEDLERLMTVEPNSTEGRALLREAKHLRKRTDQHCSKTYAKMCQGLGQLPDREDRRDDDIVVMPDLEQEYSKIVQKHGIVLPKRAAKPPPQEEQQQGAAEAPTAQEPGEEAAAPVAEAPAADGAAPTEAAAAPAAAEA